MLFKNFGLVLFILVLGRLVYWLEPLGISVDESNYMAISESWFHYGSSYVDGVDRKPPLLYILFGIVGKLFGTWNIQAIHFVYIGITFALCLLAEGLAPFHLPQMG